METVLTGPYAYNADNYTEVTGASVIMPVIQKTAQQTLAQKMKHPFKLPHLTAHPWLAPFYKRILVKTLFTMCRLRPDSPEKTLCSQMLPTFQAPHHPLPSWAGRLSCVHHHHQSFPWELVKGEERTSLPWTAGVSPTTLMNTLTSPMQALDNTMENASSALGGVTRSLLGRMRRAGPSAGLQT